MRFEALRGSFSVVLGLRFLSAKTEAKAATAYRERK